MTGANHTLYVAKETTYGTRPTSGFRALPHTNCSIAATRATNTQNNRSDENRDKTCFDKGKEVIQGEISLEWSLDLFEVFMSAALCSGAYSNPANLVLDFQKHPDYVQAGAGSVSFDLTGYGVLSGVTNSFNIVTVGDPETDSETIADAINAWVATEGGINNTDLVASDGIFTRPDGTMSVYGVNLLCSYIDTLSGTGNSQGWVRLITTSAVSNAGFIPYTAYNDDLVNAYRIPNNDDFLTLTSSVSRISYTFIRKYEDDNGVTVYKEFNGCDINQVTANFQGGQSGQDTKATGSISVIGSSYQEYASNDTSLTNYNTLRDLIISETENVSHIVCAESDMLNWTITDKSDVIITEFSITVNNAFEQKFGLSSSNTQRPSLTMVSVTGNFSAYFHGGGPKDIVTDANSENSIGIELVGENSNADLYTIPNGSLGTTVRNDYNFHLELPRCAVQSPQVDTAEGEVIVPFSFEAFGRNFDKTRMIKRGSIEMKRQSL